MAKTRDEVMQAISIAKELGMTEVTVDDVVYHCTPHAVTTTSAVNLNNLGVVPEMKAEALLSPLSVLDEMSDEEIKYWSSPYYDEIIANKERQLVLTAEEKVNE